MSPGTPPIAFGLIVIGDELLGGARRDQHLEHFRGLLAARGHSLRSYWILPDDPEVLTAHLRFSLGLPGPVFVCGGIGATPDDLTRACAAAAAGVRLVRHAGAAALIEGRFGADAYPHRIAMADLPAGSSLIPNPYNQIPGFRLGDHYFLPGFPQMAWPMAQAILDQDFPAATRQRELAVRVTGVPESQLVPLMHRIGTAFPEHKLFSLPHLGADPHIRLGLRGRTGIEAAFAALCAELEREGLSFAETPPEA